jgi:hypothetical protein
MKIGTHETHPIADALPMMPAHRLASLADDIKTNGQRVAIVLHDGLILDGRNTYLACLKAKVEPAFREFGSLLSDGDDAFRFVVSMNIERRDLDDGQRALSTRRLQVLNKQMRLPGVSDDDLELADNVYQDGTAELVAAVDAGEIRLDLAAGIATLDEDEQREKVKALTEKEEAKPDRARTVDAAMSVAVKLSPVDLVQLQVACTLLAKSPHPEARGAVDVIRKMAPGVRAL